MLTSAAHVFTEHKVYTYEESDSPGEQRAKPSSRRPDDITVLSESTHQNDHRVEEEPDEQLKRSRCQSDPGPKHEDDEDNAFLPWWRCPRSGGWTLILWLKILQWTSNNKLCV